jgi:predicted RNA binding protein YcfA (HicA-like mRNA interferase family)
MSRWTRRPDGKTIKRKSLRIDGQFAVRCIEMLESPAYCVLGLPEHRVLARIEIENAHHGGNNNDLPVTYDQFQSYGIGYRIHVTIAIRTLEALGFINVARGRGGNAEFRHPNKFGLTYRPSRPNRFADWKAPTDDWKKIKTIEKAWETVQRIKTETGSTVRTGRSSHVRTETGGSPVRTSELQAQFARQNYYLDSRGGGGAEDGRLPSPPPPVQPSALAEGERSAPVGSAEASEPTAGEASLTSLSSGRLH